MGLGVPALDRHGPQKRGLCACVRLWPDLGVWTVLHRLPAQGTVKLPEGCGGFRRPRNRPVKMRLTQVATAAYHRERQQSVQAAA